MTKYFCFFCIVFFGFQSFCQTEVIRLPVQFSQFSADWSTVSPAMLAIGSDIELNASSQVNVGPWSSIYTYNFSTYFNLNKEKVGDVKRQLFGAYFTGDREGELLQRYRAYAKYAVQLPLSYRTMLAMGASIGLMNFTVTATPISPGGGATTFDTDVGVLIYGDDWHAGLSFHQIPAGKVRPIEETARLARYINYTALRSMELNAEVELKAFALYRWVPGFSDGSTLDLDLVTILNKKASAGLGYRQARGWSFMIGLEEIPMSKGNLRTTFAYNLTGREGIINTNTLEVNLKYYLASR